MSIKVNKPVVEQATFSNEGTFEACWPQRTMISPLVQFLPIEEAPTVDIRIHCGDFNTARTTVEPVTDAGRKFCSAHLGFGGNMAVKSANFSKTNGIDFGTFAQQHGLGVEFTSQQPVTA